MERYTEVCGDNRFELIKKYKERLVAATNIETAIDEMNVIDSILFRFWQMGWLDRLEADVVPKSEVEELKADKIIAERHEKDARALHKEACIQLQNARQEVAKQIFEELIEALQGEIDAEDKQSRNAWEQSDIEGYHIHEYAEDKLDTFKIALSLYKKKYIGDTK